MNVAGVTALENVALGKPAVQQSPSAAAHAGLCTDGYNDGVYYDNSACCMLSGGWWIVDLLHVYNISHVVIYRRTDGGFPNNVVVEGFLQYPPMCPGSGLECGRLARNLQPKENITCTTPVEMRYLRVSSTSSSPSMCEVEAYGSFVRTVSSELRTTEADDILQTVPTLYSVGASLYRARAKTLPPLPKQRQDIQLPDSYQRTISG
ncbi:uncharacterized protein [Haliotis cracherodii]|uniref:uncharacterized protein n=1 Tax=Haliotis cracherodii TaxID=6455 RepID=UPI0039EA9E0B